MLRWRGFDRSYDTPEHSANRAYLSIDQGLLSRNMLSDVKVIAENIVSESLEC
jgi:hypothetical protein